MLKNSQVHQERISGCRVDTIISNIVPRACCRCDAPSGSVPAATTWPLTTPSRNTRAIGAVEAVPCDPPAVAQIPASLH